LSKTFCPPSIIDFKIGICFEGTPSMFTSFETDQKKSLSSSLVLSTAVEILSEIVEAVSFAPETILLNSQLSFFSGFIGLDC